MRSPGAVLTGIRRQEGITLVELMISMSLLSIVLVVFLNTLASVQRAAAEQEIRSRNNDQVRLALENIDRLVRSGNVLYDPSNPTGNPNTADCAAYQCFLVYTQANGTAARPARCIQWRLQDEELQSRWWLPRPAVPAASPWRVVAEGVVNQTVSPGLRTFQLNPAASMGGRTVDVVFLVGVSGSDGATARVQASLTGRNTTYGYLNDSCS